MDNFIPGNIDSRLIKASLNGASASAASANNNLVAPARNAFNIQRNSQGQLVNTETGRTVSPQDLNNEIASLNRVLSTTLGTNLDTYIQNNTKLSGNRRSYEVTNNIQLSTNTKFAIFAYSHLRLLAFYAGGSEDFSHTSLSARATAYQTTITSSEEITAIASANYQTLLNIAMSMINEASTNLENVAKVLLFAIKGSSYVQKDAVKTILGSGYDSLPLVDTYPGNSSDPRAFELLDQIVKLMITAGDNTRLLYSTGYTVANILNNNSIVNTDSDPLQNIKDIYASADAVAGNRNWLNPGIALNDPNAAQKAWDFYGQAESVLGLISPAGVSWPASASLSRELSVKKNQITSAASGFFNTFKLARAAELIAANNYSAFSLEE
ncbi:MAG: hypothetical protein LBQ83_07045, partial [Candidatus Margulisbacteria bacterium]|nr:hypothetical protein [Candidatus Margulisiibacteriota bacterium]